MLDLQEGIRVLFRDAQDITIARVEFYRHRYIQRRYAYAVEWRRQHDAKHQFMRKCNRLDYKPKPLSHLCLSCGKGYGTPHALRVHAHMAGHATLAR